MEIYLCHMVVYRILEKLKMTHLFASDVLSYFFMAVGTVIGAIVFAYITQWLLIKGQSAVKKHSIRRLQNVN